MSTPALASLAATNGLLAALFAYATVEWSINRKGIDGTIVGLLIVALFSANAIGLAAYVAVDLAVMAGE